MIYKYKKYVACLSVASNIFLIVLKLTVGFISHSISIISEAVHSMGDLFASSLAFFSVIKSSEPADKEHPFGHGKYEDMSGFIESVLLILTAFYIYFLAWEKLYTDKISEINTELGITIMLISIIVNIFVSFCLFKMAKKSDSIALYTDAQHLSADVWTSVAVLLGLLVVKVTGMEIFDTVFAVIVATIIFTTGIKLSGQTLNNLLDCSLPEEDKKAIDKALLKFTQSKIKTIKTSKSGSRKIVHLIIGLDKNITLGDAHKICDEMEEEINKNLENADVTIHPEPF